MALSLKDIGAIPVSHHQSCYYQNGILAVFDLTLIAQIRWVIIDMQYCKL